DRRSTRFRAGCRARPTRDGRGVPGADAWTADSDPGERRRLAPASGSLRDRRCAGRLRGDRRHERGPPAGGGRRRPVADPRRTARYPAPGEAVVPRGSDPVRRVRRRRLCPVSGRPGSHRSRLRQRIFAHRAAPDRRPHHRAAAPGERAGVTGV
ncbi:MAG: hypothetical protein AVDCRST_MAG73-3912, partial [uncultured Thermomicrobiales bacterium]